MNTNAIDAATSYVRLWLQRRLEMDSIPGLSVAISYNGTLIYEDALGFSDLESKKKMSVNTTFRVASHSKTITATALLKLVDDGKIALDDPIGKYLDWISDHEDERWKEVSIRQLLSHRAGVLRDGLSADYWQLDQEFPDHKTLKQTVVSCPLVIDANVRMKYSNIGYALLGQVIEAVSGQSYSTYVQDMIFKPLGLSSMTADLDEQSETDGATGYSRLDIGTKRIPLKNVPTHSLASATGLISNARDLCRMFDALKVGNGTLLSDAVKKEMQHPQSDALYVGDSTNERYGLGVSLIGNTVGHGGGFPGFITRTKMNTQSGFTVVLLTNCLGAPVVPMINSIHSILEYFKNTKKASVYDQSFVELVQGRYMNLWTVLDVVAWGTEILGVYPSSYQPLRYAERYAYVNETKLEIVDADSFASFGESVEIDFQRGRVASIRVAGMTLYPEKIWKERFQTYSAS